MEIQFLSAAAVGIALMAASPATESKARAGGEQALVGARIYASEEPIHRWGEPVRAEDLALEDLGTVADVVTDGAGAPGALSGTLVVRIGGLWGWGAQEVEVGMDRLRLVEDAAGEPRLVVDLSAEGAVPLTL